jgi:hypothetical protein
VKLTTRGAIPPLSSTSSLRVLLIKQRVSFTFYLLILFAYTYVLNRYIMSNDMQIGIMNDELERIQRKETVTYSEVGPSILVT